MLPLSLSDDELSHIMQACEPLAPERRACFVQAVADALAVSPVIGPGAVGRAIRETQRRFFDPPNLDRYSVGTRSKYRSSSGVREPRERRRY